MMGQVFLLRLSKRNLGPVLKAVDNNYNDNNMK